MQGGWQAEPERVRVEIVERLPLPDAAAPRRCKQGLLGPNMTGLTLGHSIFICRGHKARRLLSHEVRHVHHYEQAGSISAFLPIYLRQVLEVGYHGAPFEADARAHECADA